MLSGDAIILFRGVYRSEEANGLSLCFLEWQSLSVYTTVNGSLEFIL